MGFGQRVGAQPAVSTPHGDQRVIGDLLAALPFDQDEPQSPWEIDEADLHIDLEMEEKVNAAAAIINEAFTGWVRA